MRCHRQRPRQYNPSASQVRLVHKAGWREPDDPHPSGEEMRERKCPIDLSFKPSRMSAGTFRPKRLKIKEYPATGDRQAAL